MARGQTKAKTIQTSILALAAGVLLAFYGLTIFTLAGRPDATDFLKFHASVQFWRDGLDIYTPVAQLAPSSPSTTGDTLHGNLNPPAFTLLLAPFGWLSFGASYALWAALSLLIGMMTVWQLAPRVGYPEVRHRLLAVVALLAYYPTLSTVALGQVSLLLLGMIAVIWLKSRDGDDRTAGILLGLALSIKIYLGVLVVLYLLIKRWRLLIWAAATAALVQLASLLVFGRDTFLAYLQLFGTVSWFAEPRNASILGLMTRLFGGPSGAAGATGSSAGALMTQPGFAFGLSYLLSGLLIAAWVWLIWTQRAKSAGETQRTLDLGLSLSLVIMILIAPLGWIYYFVLLFIPLAVLLARGPHMPTSSWRHAGLVWLMSALPTGLTIPGGAAWMDAIFPSGLYTAALTLLFVVLFRQIRRSHSLAAERQQDPREVRVT